jgi:ankyrin repeat protein
MQAGMEGSVYEIALALQSDVTGVHFSVVEDCTHSIVALDPEIISAMKNSGINFIHSSAILHQDELMKRATILAQKLAFNNFGPSVTELAANFAKAATSFVTDMADNVDKAGRSLVTQIETASAAAGDSALVATSNKKYATPRKSIMQSMGLSFMSKKPRPKRGSHLVSLADAANMNMQTPHVFVTESSSEDEAMVVASGPLRKAKHRHDTREGASISNPLLKTVDVELVDADDDYGFGVSNQVHLAVKREDAIAIAHVLDSNNDFLLERNEEGLTPLHLAALNNYTLGVETILQHCQRSCPANLSRVLESGDSVYGMTPLMFVSCYANLQSFNAIFNSCAASRKMRMLELNSHSGHNACAYMAAGCSSRMLATSSEAVLKSTEWRRRWDLFHRNIGTRDRQTVQVNTHVEQCAAASCLLHAVFQENLGEAQLIELLRHPSPFDRWSALHFAAQAGIVPLLHFERFEQESSREALAAAFMSPNRDGCTSLHLAAWGGKASTVAAIAQALSLGHRNVAHDMNCTMLVSGKPLTPLDLAIAGGNVNTARAIILCGGACMSMAGSTAARQFIYRLLLLGDGVSFDKFTLNPLNAVHVDRHLVRLCTRASRLDCCTFAITKWSKPMHQWMFECVLCKQKVCSWCRDYCHESRLSNPPVTCAPSPTQPCKRHILVHASFSQAVCSCSEDHLPSDPADIDDHLERQALSFRPQVEPVERVTLELPGPVLDVILDTLAEQDHELWRALMEHRGWHYGETFDGSKLQRPDVTPWSKLSTSRKTELRANMERVLKFLHKNEAQFFFSLALPTELADLKAALAAVAEPMPRDTRWEALTHSLSVWRHHRWCAEMLALRWRYGRHENTVKLTHPLLIPYTSLTASGKDEASRRSTVSLLDLLLSKGFIELHAPAGPIILEEPKPAAPLELVGTRSATGQAERHAEFVYSLVRTVLLSLASDSHLSVRSFEDLFQVLLPSIEKAGIEEEAQAFELSDSAGSLLHHAVLHNRADILEEILRRCQVAKRTKQIITMRNAQGLSPLDLAAILGDVACCRLLVQYNASPKSADSNGFTPVHYAAACGNHGVYTFLISAQRRLPKQLSSRSIRTHHMLHEHALSSECELELVASRDVSSTAAFSSNIGGALEATFRPHASPTHLDAQVSKAEGISLSAQSAVASSALTVAVWARHASMVEKLLLDGESGTLVDASAISAYDRALLQHFLCKCAKDKLSAEIEGTRGQPRKLFAKKASHDPAEHIVQFVKLQAQYRMAQTIGDEQAEHDHPLVLESALKQLQVEEEACSKVLAAFHEDTRIKRHRQWFAVRALLQRIFMFFAIFMTWTVFTPAFYDYNASSITSFNVRIRNTLQDTFMSRVTDIDSWTTWMDSNFIGGEGESFVADGAALSLASSSLVGAVRLHQFTRRAVTPCTQPDQFASAPSTCMEADYPTPSDFFGILAPELLQQTDLAAGIDEGIIADLDSGDISQRATSLGVVLSNSSGGWVSTFTRSILLDVNAYDERTTTIAGVRLYTYFPTPLNAVTDVSIRTLRLSNERFQQSQSFQIVVGVLLALQCLVFVWNVIRKRSLLSAILNNGGFDVGAICIFTVVLALDVICTNGLSALRLNAADTGNFVNVWTYAGYARVENDLIAIVFLASVATMAKHFALMPGWGPLLTAMRLTLLDVQVMLFVVVILGITFAIAVAFHVAFGSESVYFATLLQSFHALFGWTFAQQTQIFSDASPRSMMTFMLVAWSIIAVLLSNLLIGVVSNAYFERASAAGRQAWEDLITRLIEKRSWALRNAGSGLIPCRGGHGHSHGDGQHGDDDDAHGDAAESLRDIVDAHISESSASKLLHHLEDKIASVRKVNSHAGNATSILKN